MTFEKDLRAAITGRVLVPGDAGFDAARTPWNVAIDQRVRAVVDVADAADVAAAVRCAGLAGLAVTTQTTGHGAAGDVDGVVLLRTAALDGVEVLPQERIARVGAGVRWGAVLAAASPHGLTGLAGSSPGVGVVGYTLGGGLSWFSRRYGLAADAVRSFDVVTADGATARVSAESDAELFWALRGGGGDLAVVTAVEFELKPAPQLYGGRMMWPADRAAELLDVYRTVTASAPDELTVWLDLLDFSAFGGAPAVAVDVTHLGSAAEGAALLKPFDEVAGRTADGRRMLPVAELGSICAEPLDPSPGRSRTELLGELDDAAAAALLDRPIAPLLSVQLRQLGGALGRPAPDGGATGGFTEQHLVYMFGIPTAPDVAAAIGERQSELAAALRPVTTGRKPFTMLAPGERAAAAFPGAALARLRDVKRARDPHGVLRSNFPVLA
ncbi:FAD-binding oxidoreductase [Pseudonocardia sp. TRM90224]|uniref:FAD-binding oxidoreductase n=1 Tax=Pseudonocardia sp. TRM90224 TaxID=2812678 RepID=UPI001E4EEF6A|nr:FAD-binding oxidoreductase [Pseudonocardia sp. TRM90224]